MKLLQEYHAKDRVIFVKDKDDNNPLVSKLKKIELFAGKKLESFVQINEPDGINIFVGIGDGKLSDNEWRELAFNISRECNKFKVEKIEIDKNNLYNENALPLLMEGFFQAEYNYDKFKSDKAEYLNIGVYWKNWDKIEVEETYYKTKSLMEGVNLARDLINEPAMNLYPETLAQIAVDKLSPLGVKVDVFNKEEIEALNMEAFLAVSKGSAKEPRLIVMEFKNDPNSDQVMGLVGKGLTYDSGGYSIKSSAGMATMHTDMGGAGTVIGAMYAIAKNDVKVNIIAVVAACENMISGSSYKTGDIIGSMSGKTIEIINTDAEGRVTLADALYYITSEKKVDCVIDLATLTGACLVALGDVATGAVTNNEALLDKVQKASDLSGELIWKLPMFDDYRPLIKSKFADLINSGGRMAGTITAGMFLQEFINEKPWVHLDIAGTSYLEKSRHYLPRGASGVGVKTLYHLASM